MSPHSSTNAKKSCVPGVCSICAASVFQEFFFLYGKIDWKPRLKRLERTVEIESIAGSKLDPSRLASEFPSADVG